MFNGKSLKFKLILSFVAVAVITIIVGLVGWRGTIVLGKKLNEISNNNIPKIQSVATMREYVTSLKLADRSLLFQNSDDVHKRIRDLFEKSTEKISSAVKKYDNLPKLKEAEEKWVELKPVLEKWIEEEKKILENIENFRNTGNKDLYQKASDISMVETVKDYYFIGKKLDELEEMTNNYNETLQKEAEKEKNTAISVAMLFMFFGAVTAVLLGVVLSITISKPINKIVEELLKGSEQVASASEQLSESSQQLAEGSSEQAASIEETSSTLNETSSMVQQNNENTRQASLLASEAKKSSEKGNYEMNEMLVAMEDIKKSSGEISKIIKVIDDIAFQTNILSLNAAVEAARAGEAGAGFAVVAEEVRNLAQRSAQAAKDTAVMIETSVERAAAGVGIAQKVAESLSEITEKSEKVNSIMDEINVASQEQAQGIIQINKAVTQMEQVTQSIAANAEESAAASEQLNSQAENMKEIVGNLTKIINGNEAGRELMESRAKSEVKKGSLNNSKKLTEVKHIKTTAYSSAKNRAVNPDEVIPLEEDNGDF